MFEICVNTPIIRATGVSCHRLVGQGRRRHRGTRRRVMRPSSRRLLAASAATTRYPSPPLRYHRRSPCEKAQRAALRCITRTTITILFAAGLRRPSHLHRLRAKAEPTATPPIKPLHRIHLPPLRPSAVHQFRGLHSTSNCSRNARAPHFK